MYVCVGVAQFCHNRSAYFLLQHRRHPCPMFCCICGKGEKQFILRVRVAPFTGTPCIYVLVTVRIGGQTRERRRKRCIYKNIQTSRTDKICNFKKCTKCGTALPFSALLTGIDRITSPIHCVYSTCIFNNLGSISILCATSAGFVLQCA